MVKEVKEEQLYHVFVPLMVRLVRLGGIVKEVKEVQLFHVLAPLMVNSVTVPPMMNVFKTAVCQI